MNKAICILFCVGCIALAECKSTRSATVATPAVKAPVAETKPAAPDPVAMAIANGQAVFQAKCYQCHDLPRVTDYSKSDWSDIMIKMSRKAHLSEAETDQVLAYINNSARQ